MRLRKTLLFLSAFLPVGKRLVYQAFFGARIAKGARIGFGSILLFDEMTIDRDVRIAPFAIIEASRISIGMRSIIGRFAHVSVNDFSLGPSCTIASRAQIKGNPRDTRSTFSAGAESWVFEFCYINVARPVQFGRNVGVGGGSYIFTHGVWLSQLQGYPVSYGGVTIGDDVWLPWGCFIMPGVTLGGGCVVGARSVVTKDVPAGALVAGSPAKVLRERVNGEVTPEQRVEILKAASKEFCASRGLALAVREDASGWLRLAFGGTDQVAIATGHEADRMVPEVRYLLRVVHEPLGPTGGTSGALYSTESFQCTPRSTFTPVQAQWLHHLRTIGTRHYPLDEVTVE